MTTVNVTDAGETGQITVSSPLGAHQIAVSVPGAQGPKGDKGDPGSTNIAPVEARVTTLEGQVTGTTPVTKPAPVTLQSSYAGGDDTSDSTSRLTVQSHQTNGNNFFGEGIRLDLMRATAKNMIAWRLPRPATSTDMNTLRTVTWAGAHWFAQDQPDPLNPTDVHGHWSIEVPDASDALRTRFEVKFVDSAGNLGVNKTLVQTANADFVVDCSNDQKLRLRTGAGAAKHIEWSNTEWGTAPRWRLGIPAGAETGSNAGSDFEIRRFTDAGGCGRASQKKRSRFLPSSFANF